MRRERKYRVLKQALALSFAGLTFVEQAEAVTKTWIGGNGLWSTPGNWNSSGVPVAGDVAFVNQGGGVTTTYTSAVPIASLSLVELSNTMTILQSSGNY